MRSILAPFRVEARPALLPRRRIGVKTVVLCGVQTPNCIRGTAVDALGLDYRVVVLSDATASKSDLVQENNLEGGWCCRQQWVYIYAPVNLEAGLRC